MTLEQQAQNTQKIGLINAFRFVAALFVVFYHFAFANYYHEISYIDIPFLRHASQYGYLGVDFFFIISGFVISLSAEGRSAYSFFKSRIGRLYPVFWVSVIISSLFILYGGHVIYSSMTWPRFFASMTMFPKFFNADSVDGTYWTLAVEMKFYFIILMLIIFKQFQKIEKFATALAIVMLAVAFFVPGLTADSDWIWVPNFIAGVMFYKIYKNGLSNVRIFTLGITFITSLTFALKRIPYLSEGYGVPFTATAISTFIVSFYIIFILISLQKVKLPNNKFVSTLGLLTYPLYLLHQQIGRILFTYADIQNITMWKAFVGITLFIFILSYLVHRIFERRGKIMLDDTLDKITPTSLKRL